MAYVIGNDCIACGTCIDECPVAPSLKATFILLIQKLAQSAELVQRYAQMRLSTFRSKDVE